MDRNNLPVSKKDRQIKYNTLGNNLDLNIINLPNNTKIQLKQKDISNIVNIGGKIIDTISNIKTIKALGEERINQIKVDIERIYAQSDIELKTIESENKSWNEKFDKKKELLFDLIDKINQNPSWSDEIKKILIETTGKIISSDQ